MKYTEMLDLCSSKNISGSQVYIAYEMNYQFKDIHKIKIDEDRFNELCDFAHYCYLKSEGLAMIQIIKCIVDYQRGWLKQENKDPLEMEKWDIINVAECYNI